nr:hypothetical protein [candidate division Zixibacteria bacterium]
MKTFLPKTPGTKNLFTDKTNPFQGRPKIAMYQNTFERMKRTHFINKLFTEGTNPFLEILSKDKTNPFYSRFPYGFTSSF